MLEEIASNKTVKENMLMLWYIVDIHHLIHTESKGIWTIETTQKNLHKVIKDVELAIQALPAAIPKEYFEKFNAFPRPHVIPLYGNSYKYTTQITQNVLSPSDDDKENALPPKNAWSRGSPIKIRTKTALNNQSKEKSNGKKTASNYQYSELKESMEHAMNKIKKCCLKSMQN
eukprot:12310145-Ditylum_brightwellii.AAC.1